MITSFSIQETTIQGSCHNIKGNTKLISIHLLRFLIKNLHSLGKLKTISYNHHKTVNETAAERSFTPSSTHFDSGAITPAIIVFPLLTAATTAAC